jgi:hypothetical protein
LVRRSLTAQVAFWGELTEPRPDLTRCHMLCAEMNTAINGAEHAFKQLLAINSQSLLALRLYAGESRPRAAQPHVLAPPPPPPAQTSPCTW